MKFPPSPLRATRRRSSRAPGAGPGQCIPARSVRPLNRGAYNRATAAARQPCPLRRRSGGAGLLPPATAAGGHRQAHHPAQAAPYLRHQPAQRRGRAGGHQGAARPREHQHHADLHQRRPGADGAGGGEVVSANIQSTSAARSSPCLLSDQRERSTIAKLTLKRLVINALQGDASIWTAGECLGALDAEG
jgi:hypothetical protein